MPVSPIYSRSQVYSFDELPQNAQKEMTGIYNFEMSDCHSTHMFVCAKNTGTNIYPCQCLCLLITVRFGMVYLARPIFQPILSGLTVQMMNVQLQKGSANNYPY